MSTTVDPAVQQMVNNVCSYMTLDVGVNVLLGNIYTMQAHNDSLNVITDANQQLTDQWNSSDQKDWGWRIQDDWPTINGEQGPGLGLDAWIAGANAFSGTWPNPTKMTETPLSQFTLGMMVQLMSILAANFSKIGSTATMDNTVLNSWNSSVSAQANLEEQPGQNLAKTEGGVVSNDSGTQQTDTSILDAVQGWNGSISSLLQQSYAG